MSTRNRYNFGGGSAKASRGAREKVSSKENGVLHEDEQREQAMGHMTEEPMAVVGMSINVGMSTEFAREKIEISCWESRPCHDNPKDRARVKGEIASDLTMEAGQRLDACIREFFPHMLPSEDR